MTEETHYDCMTVWFLDGSYDCAIVDKQYGCMTLGTQYDSMTV